MNDGEYALLASLQDLVSDDCSQLSKVSCASIGGLVSDDAISSFEELVREGIGLIFVDGPKQAGKETGPTCLELLSLGVLDLDELGLVLVENAGGDLSSGA